MGYARVLERADLVHPESMCHGVRSIIRWLDDGKNLCESSRPERQFHEARSRLCGVPVSPRVRMKSPSHFVSIVIAKGFERLEEYQSNEGAIQKGQPPDAEIEGISKEAPESLHPEQLLRYSR